MSGPAIRQKEKFVIGVTGNIATGKSVVMRLAAEHGALTIDADRLVHQIMDGNVEMQAAIAVAFGPEVRRPDGRIDRSSLGEIVFNDSEAMRDLEEMVHPAVSKEVLRQLSETDRTLVFIEAIKLLEGELAKLCQQVWVTRCTKKRQLERLRICRGLDTPSAAIRIKAQPPQEDKVAMADVVIDTDGYMTETTTQFERAWARLPDWAVEAAAKVAGTTARTMDGPIPRPIVPSAQERSRAGEAASTSSERPVQTAVSPPELAATEVAGDEPTISLERPENLEVRRARPSDVASVLLLIQKATDGAAKLKRKDLLLALSERSYFIGQVGSDVNAVMGMSIDSQVARIDQVYIHPIDAGMGTASAIVEEIEKSANAHICELVVAFLAMDAPADLRRLFNVQGYEQAAKESLPRAWQSAIEESQPEDTYFLIKVLRGERLMPASR